MSSTFGRASDFDGTSEVSKAVSQYVLESSIVFDREAAGSPKKDPWFGTYYWVQDVAPSLLQEWSELSSPQMPPEESMLSLPPKNPFVPSKFDLKPTPPDDTHHPLINCSMKLCISLGKQKVSCQKCS